MSLILRLRNLLRINWLKTVYINIYYFGIKQGFKMPIFIYRHTALLLMGGEK